MKRLLFVVLFGMVTTAAHAQHAGVMPPDQPGPRTASLAGPRFGVTFLSDGVVGTLRDRNIEVGNAMSQFGWQFEKQFYAKAQGPTVLNEWVLLAGGLDQGVVLPSLNWMVGLRSREGAEVGIGPNITPAGVALAVAAGVNFRAGIVNMPMTFAVVPSKHGIRVSMLGGFTLRR